MARKLEVTIVGDASSLNKAFGKASKSGSRFGSAMAKVGKLAAFGLAGIGVGAAVAGKKMIDMASDAAEVQSKMDVVFGKSLPGLTKNIDAFSAATGTSRFAMREQAADLGALLAPLVGTKQKAADMSMQFTKLATDLGSFNNVPTADALLAIRSGLVGEAEPLRRFGVLLNEAAVKAEGLRLGLIKGNEAMTEQEKVQARASLIMQQTTLAQGDATRTAGSMANQMKALKTALSDTATEMGMVLLPWALKVVTAFNTHWPVIKRVAGEVLSSIGNAIRDLAAAFERNWPRIRAAGQSVMAWYKANLEPTIVSVARNIQLAWSRTMTALTSDAKGGTSKTSGLWRTWASGLVSTLNAALALLRGDWSAAWANMKTAVVQFTKTVNAVLTGFQNVIRAVASAIGRAIVDGIVSGASGLGSRLKDKLTGEIGDAIGGIRGFIESRSPSKLTARVIGKPLGEGIVQGMDGGLALLLPKAAARIKAFTDKLAAQIVGSRARLSAAFGSLTDKLLRAFDAQTGGHTTAAGGALNAISARRQQEDLAGAVEDAQARLQEAQEGGDPADIAAAQRALYRAQEDVQMVSLEAQRLEQEKAYADQREATREAFEKRIALMSAGFAKEGATVKTALTAIQTLMLKYGISFQEAGADIGRHFAAGLASSVGGAAAGAASVRGSLTGGNANVNSRPIVTQVILDSKVVAESVRTQNQIYQRANGMLAV